MFCDNPKCEHHVSVLYGKTMIVMKGEKRIELNRFRYTNKSGDEINLCSICHAAVQLAAGKTEQK